MVGGAIYILTRPDSLLMFDWFTKFGINEYIIKLRYGINLNKYLNDWIIYNSPAWIWSFSFTFLLGVVWQYKINRESIFFLLVPLLLGVISEILQLTGMIKGTFDFIDLIMNIIGWFSGLFLIRITNYKFKIY